MTEDLFVRRKVPFSLLEARVLETSDEQLLEMSRELGLALSLQEMKIVRDYFSRKGRNPTNVELQAIAQTWSEHCFHKTFKDRIRFNGKLIDGLFKTYIASATKKIGPHWCFSVFEDNAGIVNFDKGFGVPKDWVQAETWLILATSQSGGRERDYWMRIRNGIALKLTLDQRAEAQRRAYIWAMPFSARF